ncbi:DUF2306 domain-containing protein [Psychroserpens ponticola]|uniref:DUF2306 domain-containing protein n=1 Tax=Psychroserpens ponticola TaxID=2932268 RepID=A0ABY7S2H0_9FLAO|nr:DUF2306 domain-containing protein [Psychroserpens ponticola]WCO03364.1 DUF2306 domain-containing protein [Psychroserpens ponticola]
MTKKLGLIIFASLCIIIGLYPLLYFIIDSNIGILTSKSAHLLNDGLWNIGFYMHISLGGLALLVGWTQFREKLRKKNKILHRNLGRIYLISVLISGLSALYIAYFATGGIVSILGFSCLAIVWLYTTVRAYLEIINRSISKHQKFMTYSYAACFAAVTLRIWLPILIAFLNDFIIAYRIVAWLCWVPNIIFAYYMVKQQKMKRHR